MKKVLALLLAVAMFACIGAFLLSKRSEPKDKITVHETEEFSLAASEYTAAIKTIGAGGEIYLPTYIGGIYYTADLNGNITFYNFINGDFNPYVGEVKTAKVNMSISKDTIPMEISYITVGGKVVGFGVYTSEKGGSKYFEYAFTQLRTMPEGYGNTYLLLTDYDKEDFYKADKTYDEIYEYDLSAKSVSVKYSQNTRLIDRNGTYRQDWAMLSDEFIEDMGSEKYFMSSRYYNQSETGKRTDVMVYSSAYRPKIIATDIIGQWFAVNDEGRHYLKKTDEGFKAVCKKEGDEKAKDVVKFKGDFFGDYIQSGSYIVEKATGEITNLLNGDKKEIKADISKATGVSINKEGTKAVFTFDPVLNDNGVPVQKLVYADVNGNVYTYSEPMLYCAEASFVWIDDNSCMSVRPLNDDGIDAGSVIYTFA